MSAQLNRKWGPLSRPVCPAETLAIARAMSAKTANGEVPTYAEAKRYAQQQGPSETYDDDLRDGFAAKYGLAHEAG